MYSEGSRIFTDGGRIFMLETLSAGVIIIHSDIILYCWNNGEVSVFLKKIRIFYFKNNRTHYLDGRVEFLKYQHLAS